MADSKRVIDLTGQTFSRLTVLRQNGRSNGKVIWLCRCECGNETSVHSNQLRCGKTRSCGCLRDEALRASHITHGKTDTSEYVIWKGMVKRCTNPNCRAYPNYGGRGIAVCERWLKFEAFYADMGPRPSKRHSLDRIDNDRGYEPGNVRWASAQEQAQNRRNSSDGLEKWIKPRLIAEVRRLRAQIPDPNQCTVSMKAMHACMAENDRLRARLKELGHDL